LQGEVCIWWAELGALDIDIVVVGRLLPR